MKLTATQQALQRDPMLLIRARYARRIIKRTRPNQDELLSYLAAVVWPEHPRTT